MNQSQKVRKQNEKIDIRLCRANQCYTALFHSLPLQNNQGMFSPLADINLLSAHSLCSKPRDTLIHRSLCIQYPVNILT